MGIWNGECTSVDFPGSETFRDRAGNWGSGELATAQNRNTCFRLGRGWWFRICSDSG